MGARHGSLFDELWGQALDPSYAARYAHRATEEPAHGLRRLAGRPSRSAVALALVGLLLGFEMHQLGRSVGTGRASRAALVGQVRQRERDLSALQAEAQHLRDQVAAARNSRLAQTAAGSAAARQLAALEQAAAAVPVRGPGLVLTLSDPPGRPAGPAAPGQPGPVTGPLPGTGQLTDRDLQAVVNALWAAGAEAITVGGYRLGPQTAIRTAGQAVLVDFRPVASPYVVQAIGDRNALDTQFADSPVGRRLRTLHAVYGTGLKLRTADGLTLAAALPSTPRFAEVLGTSGNPAGGPGGGR